MSYYEKLNTIIVTKLAEKLDINQVIQERIDYELSEVKKSNAAEILLVAIAVKDICYKNELYFTGSGDICSLYTAYLLGLTDINPIKYKLTNKHFFKNYPILSVAFEVAENSIPIIYEKLKEYYQNYNMVLWGENEKYIIFSNKNVATNVEIDLIENLTIMLKSTPNAEKLQSKGKFQSYNEIIKNFTYKGKIESRDDVYDLMLEKRQSEEKAFEIAEYIRKGKLINNPNYIDDLPLTSIEKQKLCQIYYLLPKSDLILKEIQERTLKLWKK